MTRLIPPEHAVVPLKPLRSATHLVHHFEDRSSYCTTACGRRLVIRSVRILNIDDVKAIDLCKRCLGAMTADDSGVES